MEDRIQENKIRTIWKRQSGLARCRAAFIEACDTDFGELSPPRDWEKSPWNLMDEWAVRDLYYEDKPLRRKLREYTELASFCLTAWKEDIRAELGLTGIIDHILESDKTMMLVDLRDDPNAINTIHKRSGMNAAMLAASGRLPDYVDAMIEAAGNQLDFERRSKSGKNFMEVAIGTEDIETIQAVQRAYERFAPHLIAAAPTAAPSPEGE